MAKLARKGRGPVSGSSSAASDQWTVADAKARLSEVIDRAQGGASQVITRNGKRAVVVVGFDKWEEKTRRKGTLAEFFMNSPLRGSNLEIERVSTKPRDIDL